MPHHFNRRLADNHSYNHLMTHRFASHVLETLFTRAAPFVSDEVKHGITSDEGSLEDCFLSVLSEIEGNVGYLITDQYASHVLRNILLIVAGEPLSKEALKTLRSKKKESIKKHEEEESKDKEKVKLRTVPESFKKALEKLIAESMAGLPTDKLRALATHPNANPTLQLLLRLELSHLGKQRAKEETSVIRTLLPDEPITEDCDSTSFINGMVYDPVGSHLVETVVQAAPAKLFKNLYKVIFHDRIASYARNEIASHIACRVLERLGQDDLLEMHEVLIPHICDLLRKNKTNVVRTLIERCAVREIDTKVIALQVNDTWSTPDGFEIRKLIKTAKVPIKAEDDENPAPELTEQELSEINVSESVKTHFNLLAQAMLLVPGALSALVLESMITLGAKELFELAFDPIVSRTIQTALTTRVTSIITTRKLVQAFYGQIGEMSLDKSASHVVDCIWEGTHGLAFIRERIAEELAENEADLRNSPFGRAVWKNWKMDIYKRRRSEWVRQSKIKASNDGFQSFSELDERKKQNGEQKTPLQLARERHARDKKAKQEAEAKEKETNGRPSSAGSGDGAAPAMAAAA